MTNSGLPSGARVDEAVQLGWRRYCPETHLAMFVDRHLGQKHQRQLLTVATNAEAPG